MMGDGRPQGQLAGRVLVGSLGVFRNPQRPCHQPTPYLMGKQRRVGKPCPKVEAGRAIELGQQVDRVRFPNPAWPQRAVGSRPCSALCLRQAFAHERPCPRSGGHEAFGGEAIVGGDHGAARNRQRLSQLAAWREIFTRSQLPDTDRGPKLAIDLALQVLATNEADMNGHDPGPRMPVGLVSFARICPSASPPRRSDVAVAIVEITLPDIAWALRL
jgi:hypothetical protein